MGRAQWVLAGPLIVIVVFLVVALTVYPLLYALFGTSVPGLVNEGGGKGPAPIGDRLEALGFWVAWMLVLCCGAWVFARRRFGRPSLAIDSEGVWFVAGGRVQGGLEWEQIAAVHLVEDDRSPLPAGSVTPPFVEIFPVAPIKDLGVTALVVNAPPPRAGLRGKRYVAELAGPSSALQDALEEFAAHKRLAPAE